MAPNPINSYGLVTSMAPNPINSYALETTTNILAEPVRVPPFAAVAAADPQPGMRVTLRDLKTAVLNGKLGVITETGSERAAMLVGGVDKPILVKYRCLFLAGGGPPPVGPVRPILG
jgi:hypothetical protein